MKERARSLGRERPWSALPRAGVATRLSVVSLAAGVLCVVTAALGGCGRRPAPVDEHPNDTVAATPALHADSPDSALAALARRYRALRTLKGHWSGGAFNPTIDAPNSPFHLALLELGERLGRPGTPRQVIIELLGEPDAVEAAGDREHLVYHWRGRHDYLTFVCRAGAVEHADWYHAYE